MVIMLLESPWHLAMSTVESPCPRGVDFFILIRSPMGWLVSGKSAEWPSRTPTNCAGRSPSDENRPNPLGACVATTHHAAQNVLAASWPASEMACSQLCGKYLQINFKMVCGVAWECEPGLRGMRMDRFVLPVSSGTKPGQDQRWILAVPHFRWCVHLSAACVHRDPATGRDPSAGRVLGQRQRRWPSTLPALPERLLSAGAISNTRIDGEWHSLPARLHLPLSSHLHAARVWHQNSLNSLCSGRPHNPLTFWRK